jgi:hypothetical protein
MAVRAKKAKKPPRSIRYLLSGDSRLQKLSLRKISERVKKAKAQTRPNRLKDSAGARKAMPVRWAVSTRAMALGVICVVAAAALITARQPSDRADVATMDARPEANAQPETVPAAPRLAPTPTVVLKAPTVAVAARPQTASSMTKTPAAAPVKAAVVESAPKRAALESTTPDAQDAAAVTITGCLELTAETFRLTNTSGADLPKSRSWKSGFLKRRPSSIELVDASNRLRLPDHVGQRVAATGTLMNREMRAHSLRRVSSSCE